MVKSLDTRVLQTTLRTVDKRILCVVVTRALHRNIYLFAYVQWSLIHV